MGPGGMLGGLFGSGGPFGGLFGPGGPFGGMGGGIPGLPFPGGFPPVGTFPPIGGGPIQGGTPPSAGGGTGIPSAGGFNPDQFFNQMNQQNMAALQFQQKMTAMTLAFDTCNQCLKTEKELSEKAISAA
jgi:hypothetical protein